MREIFLYIPDDFIGFKCGMTLREGNIGDKKQRRGQNLGRQKNLGEKYWNRFMEEISINSHVCMHI